MNERLRNTICVAGNGRSGTTIFYKVLGSHPELAWVSNAVERFPGLPEVSVFSKLYPLALKMGPNARLSRFIPKPAESLRSVRKCSNGLFQVPHELTTQDIPAETIQSVRKYHERIITWQGRKRLALKHTGFPRFEFWRLVFPDANFIQILRDGRAVVYSVMRVSWWKGSLDGWWWGPIPEEYMEEYEKSGRRPAVLAAIGWKRLLDLYEEATEALPENNPVTIVRYDAFTADPVSVMKYVEQFCNLPESPVFEECVSRFVIRDADTAWKKGLSREDLQHVENVVGDHLAKYGFA